MLLFLYGAVGSTYGNMYPPVASLDMHAYID
jgi:hypothetical protein